MTQKSKINIFLHILIVYMGSFNYLVRSICGYAIVALSIIAISCKEDEIDLKDPFIEISKFPAGKRAALSITFDDGCPSVFTKIVPMVEKYGWKCSFYIISAMAEKKDLWAKWIELRNQGHEVGNHSLTHGYYLGALYDEELLKKEIDSSFTLMKIRMGEAPFVFSHPYHSTSPMVDNIVFRNHYASRISPPDFCRLISLNNISSFESEMANAVKNNQWIVTTAHGIDDCFNPMTQNFFDSFLTAVDMYKDSLHIDTFENVAKYKIESEYTKVKISKGGPGYTVHLANNLPNEVFNYPLTISVCNLNPDDYTIQSVAGESIPMHVEESLTYFEILPGTSFVIKMK